MKYIILIAVLGLASCKRGYYCNCYHANGIKDKLMEVKGANTKKAKADVAKFCENAEIGQQSSEPGYYCQLE